MSIKPFSHPVEKAKLLIWQLLLLGHHVLCQLEKRILVTPQQLAHADLHEWFDLEDVHDGGHSQAKEACRMLGLGSSALEGDNTKIIINIDKIYQIA